MIKWGLFPTESNWNISVGQMVGGKENYQVVEIIKELSIEEGTIAFHILCRKMLNEVIPGHQIPDKDKKWSEVFVWNTYYKLPDNVQYFYPDEKHNYIKA